MSHNTKIEWCDHTFNPWEGCQETGPGCDHCYARAMNARFNHGVAINFGPGAPRRRTSAANRALPRRWNAQADAFMAQHGRRQRVFALSLGDWADNQVPIEWLVDFLEVVRTTPGLDWLLLTKRIGLVKSRLHQANAYVVDNWPAVDAQPLSQWLTDWLEGGFPPANVWLGATIASPEEAGRDIPKLLNTPALIRFLSMEPLLADVRLGSFLQRSPSAAFLAGRAKPDMPDWTRIGSTAIDWVIVGGESGAGARPIHPDWIRSLRDECVAAGVPFLFKQWGEYDLSYDRDRDDPDYRRCATVERQPGRWINLAGGHGFNGERVHYAQRVGKKAAGRLLDGRSWDEFPGVPGQSVTMYYGSPDCKAHAIPLAGRTEIEG